MELEDLEITDIFVDGEYKVRMKWPNCFYDLNMDELGQVLNGRTPHWPASVVFRIKAFVIDAIMANWPDYSAKRDVNWQREGF